MSAYGQQTTHKPTPLFSIDVVQKKAARRKILEAVEKRRRENYIRFFTKMRLRGKRGLDTMA